MASCLQGKSGVECIDVNDFLMETFVSVGFDSILEEAEAGSLPKVNFKRVSKDLVDIQDLMMTLKSKVQDQEYSSDENLAPQKEKEQEPKAQAPAPEPAPEPAAAPEDQEEVPEDIPSPEDSSPPQEQPEEEPLAEPQSKQDAIDDLTNMENMVADIAAEMGIGSEEEK